MVYTTSVTDRSTFGNRQVTLIVYTPGRPGCRQAPGPRAGRRPRSWRGGPRSDRHREVRPRVKPYVGVRPYRIPRYQDTHGPPAGWAGSPTKDARSAVITLPNANRCFGFFWLEVQDPRMRARSPSTRSSRSGALAARAAATRTPCGRRRALRNRAAAGKSRRGENPPVDQQRRTEHAPLRATRPWTTCARTRSGSERTRSSALPSHHILICLQPLHMWYTGLALGLIKL